MNAPPIWLLLRVLIPNTSLPETKDAPRNGLVGIFIRMPLLSSGSSATGFRTCADSATAATLHPPQEQPKYIDGCCGPNVAQTPPQSAPNNPSPRIPLKPICAGLCATGGPFLHTAGITE